MENNHNEYSENSSEDDAKATTGSGNNPKRIDTDNAGNKSFEKSTDGDYNRNSTTGSGYSELERELNDGTNSQNPAESADNGSQELVDKYNINDKAYSDSSKADFVETVSKFRHADEENEDNV